MTQRVRETTQSEFQNDRSRNLTKKRLYSYRIDYYESYMSIWIISVEFEDNSFYN